MNEYEAYCLRFPQTELTYPFDATTKVFKVAGKIFAIMSQPETISLKCDPERALDYRAMYQGVQPGYHLNKTHWNTVSLTSDVAPADLKYMIQHSYEQVIAKLPKRQATQLTTAWHVWLQQEEETSWQ